MAGGELGDLRFSLGVEDKTSKDLRSILTLLDKIDASGDKSKSSMRLMASIVKGLTGNVQETGVAWGKVSLEVEKLTRELKRARTIQDWLSDDKSSAGYKKITQQINSYTQVLEHYRSVMRSLQDHHPGGTKVPFFNEGGAKDLQRVYGQAFDTLGKQADELKTKIDKTLADAATRQAGLTAQMRKLSPNLDGLQYNGKKLSPQNQAAYEALGAELSRVTERQGAELDTLNAKYASLRKQMEGLVTLSERLAQQTERMQNATYKPYATSEKEEAQARLQRTNELKRAMTERMEEEKRAQAEAKRAAEEQAAAIKRLKANVEAARRSYGQLFDLLNSLRKVRAEGNVLGLDVGKIDGQIANVRAALHLLRNDMREASQMGTLSAMGRKGYSFTGLTDREVTLAGRAVQEQQRLNAEKRKSIEAERQHAQAVARTAAEVRTRLVRAFEDAKTAAGKTSGAVEDLKGLLLQGGIVYGAQQFLRSVIETGGQLEQQHIALQTILGDMQNANTLFGQIQELALNSPFTFSELNKDVKQLAAYGVEYDQLYDTTKRLADMASGLGVSFERIALAFGQVQARGWLDGKELRQIAYAGIPLLDKLSKYYSQREGRKVTTSEVKTRISGRGVDFEDVKNVFWEMTDAGGQFYNMQQTLSETLLGRWNKLKDAWEIMLSEFASGKSVLGGTLMTAVNGVTALVQGFHQLAPLVTAAMSGFALKKLSTALGGGVGAGYLANKAAVATEAQKKLLLGEELSQVEQRILLTKGRITQEDLQQLAEARALTQLDLQRLRVSGQITAEQYRQAMAIVRQKTGAMTLGMEWKRLIVTMRSVRIGAMWQSFSTSATAAFGVVKAGAVTLGRTLWAAIGGLPGLIISVASTWLMKLWSDHQELTDKMEQTGEELESRMKSLREFMHDNPIEVAIGDGDGKAMQNLIDNYKEKLKELAGADYDSIAGEAARKKSREEELAYLKERLQLLERGAALAKGELGNRHVYKAMTETMEEAKDVLDDYMKKQAKALSGSATADDKAAFARAADVLVKRQGMSKSTVQAVADYLKNLLTDVSTNPETLAAAKQMMDSIASQLKYTDEQKNVFRASVLDALGVSDTWLESEVGGKMSELVAKTSDTIAMKIRAGKELTASERAKVEELMKDAEAQLAAKYPNLSGRLKELLARDRFEAVIDLTFGSMSGLGELERRIYGNLTGGAKGDMQWQAQSAKYNALRPYLKGQTSYYEATNAVKSELDKRWNELKRRQNMAKAGKLTEKELAEARKSYTDLYDAAWEGLGYRYTPEDKKSDKKPKTRTQEDKALKDLRERVALYKKMYGEIKKYRDLFGAGALGQLAKDGEFGAIFGDRKRFPISDYSDYKKSVEELLATLPGNTQERRDFKDTEKAGIQGERRKDMEENRRDELDTLNKQLDVIEEQYATYKKLYELTGNKTGAERVAFGGTVQSDTYRKYLEEKLDAAVRDDNAQSGLRLDGSAVAGMSLKDVKEKYGSDSRTYLYREKLEEEQNRLKKESIDLLSDLIEKNATIAQQIEDENARYERQKTLVQQIEDPALRKRAEEGNDKTHDERLGALRLEQFKQESDWVTVFDDLDRVSTAVIDTMVRKIDDFSHSTGLGVEEVKQLRDALEKLRSEQIGRNPLPYIFGEVKRGNAIGSYIKRVFRGESDPTASTYVDKKTGARLGLAAGHYSLGQLKGAQQGAYADSSKAIGDLSSAMNALSGVMQPVIDLFGALGQEDSVLGTVVGGASGALSSAAGVAGNISTLSKMKGFGFLSKAAPYAAAATAAISIGGTIGKALFGPNYSAYNKAKKEYDNLVDVWDELIDKKKKYLSESWGQEAKGAAEDAAKLYASEITATQEIARQRLRSGGSMFSHTVGYKMWKGSHKDSQGRTWHDVAGEISRARGVKFDNMADMLYMSREDLEWIMQNYPTLWARMDGDFKSQIEKIMQIRENVEDLGDELTEKLTGMKFETMVDNWASALSQMSNGFDSLVDNVEDGLKKAILSSVISSAFGDRIKALTAKAAKMAEGIKTGVDPVTGSVTVKTNAGEYSAVMSDTEKLAKEIEAVRDLLKQSYGWSDSSTSSGRNSVAGITEEQADLGLSYMNAMRLDISGCRETLLKIADTAGTLPDMGEVAKSQLTQLLAIADSTRRSAEAAEDLLDIMKSVTTSGRKRVYVG